MKNEELKINKLNECGVLMVNSKDVSKAMLNRCYQNSHYKNLTLHFQPFTLKRAFTLAEVLITLGIIGVVAAISLPTIINNINEIDTFFL